jgi:hypothetical protein
MRWDEFHEAVAELLRINDNILDELDRVDCGHLGISWQQVHKNMTEVEKYLRETCQISKSEVRLRLSTLKPGATPLEIDRNMCFSSVDSASMENEKNNPSPGMHW